MSLITLSISRALFTLEQRLPRMTALSQGAARFFGCEVAERLEEIRQHSLLCRSMRTGPQPDKKNCWEHSECCKQVHGSLSGMLGVCPASLESRLDGVHGGKNGGRACWVVPGTHCYGAVQDSQEQKRITCGQCGFYLAVRAEEGLYFIYRNGILQALLK